MASELNVGSLVTTGNVGVACSPSARFEVEDGGTSSSLIAKITADDGNPYALGIGNDTYSTDDLEGMSFWVANSGNSYIQAADDGSSPGNMYLRTDGTARLTIDSAGLATFSNGIDVNTTGNFIKLEAYQTVSVADDATFSLSSSSCNSALVSVYDTTSGAGGVFFISYSSTAILVANAGSASATDLDGNMCVYKSAASHSATFKNRLGATKSFNVVQLGGYLG